MGTPGEISLVEAGPLRVTFEVRTTLRVPLRLTPDRSRRTDEEVEVPITTRIALSAERERAEVRTTIDNRAEDHLLRALFPVPVRTERVRAQGQFVVDERPVRPLAHVQPALALGDEADVFAFPHHGWVDAADARCGLAVLDRGLAEAEALEAPDGTHIALTLLRCVGWLARPDLRTRPDEAGSMSPTPEAQCPGIHTFEYAVVPHAGDALAADVHRQAEAYVTPIHSTSVPRTLPEGERASYYAIEPSELVFSALKKAEDGERLVLRFTNLASREVTARIWVGWKPREVWRADLAERPLEPLACEEGVVRMPVRGAEIVTLLLSR